MIVTIIIGLICVASLCVNFLLMKKLLNTLEFCDELVDHVDKMSEVTTTSIAKLVDAQDRINTVAELPLAANDEFVMSVARSVTAARDAVKDILSEVQVVHEMYDVEGADDDE